MKISVIISNMNGERFLNKLLESIINQEEVETEIIIVDRNSTDNSAEIISKYKDVKVISEPPQTGLVSGYHKGTSIATGNLLFFCNEDMYFDKRCLSELQKHIDLEKGIFAADPWQWTYDQKIWIHGGVSFDRAKLSLFVHPFYKVNPINIFKSGTAIPFGCAGAVLIEKNKYFEIEGWDTTFFLDAEDLEFFFRAWRKKLFCVTVKEAKVYHYVGASNPTDLNKKGVKIVGKRRYISAISNDMNIGLKHYHKSNFFIPAVLWLAHFTNNLLRMRFKLAGWNLLSLLGVLKQSKRILQYRKKNKELRSSQTENNFFDNSKFQLSYKNSYQSTLNMRK